MVEVGVVGMRRRRGCGFCVLLNQGVDVSCRWWKEEEEEEEQRVPDFVVVGLEVGDCAVEALFGGLVGIVGSEAVRGGVLGLGCEVCEKGQGGRGVEGRNGGPGCGAENGLSHCEVLLGDAGHCVGR